MKTKVVVKKFLGTGSTMAKLTFYPNRKYYTPIMKVRIEIYTGRNSEGAFDCNSIAEVSEKIQAFYLEKNGHDLEIRRLARWYIEYLEAAGLEPPEQNKILKDMQSKPSEVQAREGLSEEVKEDDDDDEDEDDDEEEEDKEEAPVEVEEVEEEAPVEVEEDEEDFSGVEEVLAEVEQSLAEVEAEEVPVEEPVEETPIEEPVAEVSVEELADEVLDEE